MVGRVAPNSSYSVVMADLIKRIAHVDSKMKVLLVTSVLEKEAVERYAKQSKVETHVLALNVAVAAFLTPKTIIEALKNIGPKRLRFNPYAGLDLRRHLSHL